MEILLRPVQAEDPDTSPTSLYSFAFGEVPDRVGDPRDLSPITVLLFPLFLDQTLKETRIY